MQTSRGINTPLEPSIIYALILIHHTQTYAKKKLTVHVNEILLLKFNIFSNMTLFNLTIFAIIIKKILFKTYLEKM